MWSLSGPACQSCGIAMSLDERGGGTEADGTKNPEYCSHCYGRGQFLHPILTMPQMLLKVSTRLRELHCNESQIARVTGSLPTLKRWRAQPPG